MIALPPTRPPRARLRPDGPATRVARLPFRPAPGTTDDRQPAGEQ